jgi:hypothetical protein
VLIQHLLKCEHQPDQHSRSWDATIKDQRRRVNRLLEENPSLKPKLAQSIDDAYQTAVTFASVETGILEEDFPSACQYTTNFILTGEE